MTEQDRQMLDMLRRGRDAFGFVAIKAEFEAEGTRPDEFQKLLDLTRKADLKVALKIGGCEAITDLHASRLYGVDYIIAPMVETPYALSKFVDARDKVYGPPGHYDTHFLVNVETHTSLANLDDIAAVALAGQLNGIVFGRVDFTLSNGFARSAVNDARICEAVLKVGRKCADLDLDLVVGGSVSRDAMEALRLFAGTRLDRFETRKVVFDGAIARGPKLGAAIDAAVEFELAWLKSKRAHYRAIASEDDVRIEMIESRLAPEDRRAVGGAGGF